jgi:hypothetical protein
MTIEEALRVLGVDGSAGRDAARRAYLRLLKQHNPEVDPRGFAGLREAWELVDRVHQHSGEILHDHAEATAPRPLAADDPLAAYVARLQTLPASAGWPERAAIAREAVAAHPSLPEAHGLLLRALQGAPAAEVAPVLRAAAAQGFDGFFDLLIWHLAEGATDAELERARTHPDLKLRLRIASVLVARGRLADGAQILTDACRAAAEGGAEGPFAFGALGVLLELQAAGEVELARAASAAYRAYLAQAPRADAPAGPLAPTWAVLQELGSLPPDFPRVLREGVARAIQRGRPDEAATQGEVFVLSKGRKAAKWWAMEIGGRAPNVLRMLQLNALSQPEIARPRPSGGIGVAWIWFVPMAISALTRIGPSCSRDRNDDRPEPPTRLVTPPAPAGAEELPTAFPPLAATSTVESFKAIDTDLRQVCADAPLSVLCKSGAAARRALAHGQCDDAYRAINESIASAAQASVSSPIAERCLRVLKKVHTVLCMRRFSDP